MTLKKFERICNILKINGFRPVGMDGPTKRVFIDDDHKINVTVEFDIDQLSKEDEERIKERLKELGYLWEKK